MRSTVAVGTAVGAAMWLATLTPSAAQSRRGANYFPNVALTTQDGATVHFYDDLLKGKIVAINLIYTTCKYSCPLETARLAQVQRILGDRMGRDVFFYSITIDPEHDTPEVLKAYAAKFHAGVLPDAASLLATDGYGHSQSLLREQDARVRTVHRRRVRPFEIARRASKA